MKLANWTFIFFSTVVVGTENVRPFYEHGTGVLGTLIEITSLCLKDERRPINIHAIQRHLFLRHINSDPSLNHRLISYDVCFDMKKLSSVIAQIFFDKQYLHGHSCGDPYNKISFVYSYMTHRMTSVLDKVLIFDEISHIAIYTDSNGLNFIPKNSYMISEDIVLQRSKDWILDIVWKYSFKHVTLVYFRKNARDWPNSGLRQQIWDKLISVPDICVEMINLNATNSTVSSSYIATLQRKTKNKLVIVWSSEELRYSIPNLAERLSDYSLWFTERSPFEFYFKSSYVKLANFGWPENLIEHFGNEVLIKQFLNENGLDFSTINFSSLERDWTVVGDYAEWLWIQTNHHELMQDLFRFTIYYSESKHNLLHEFNTASNQSFLLVNRKEEKYKCKLNSCPPGREPIKAVFKKTFLSIKAFEWQCRRCAVNKVKSNHSLEDCISCPSLTVPNEDSTRCIDPFKDIYLSYNDVKSLAFLTVNIIFLFYNMALLIIFIYHRKTPLIAASGSTSNIVQLLAHFSIFFQFFALFFGKLNVHKCTFQVIINGILFTLILSLLFTKIQKSLVAFKSKVRLSRKDVIILQASEVFITLLLLGFDIVTLIISYQESEVTIETRTVKKSLNRIVICKNEQFFRSQYFYILALSVLCSIQAFRSRNLPKYFSEATEVGYSMYITLVIQPVSQEQ